MMNVKLGTSTWSAAKNDPIARGDGPETLSVEDKERALGNEDLGAVLNRVADPNYVDPAKMRKVGSNTLDKDAFLKLMLTQMKYQDPGNPMQSHEMAAQLAQFTSLEQLSNINSTLQSMKSQNAPVTNFQALNFIGKQVAGDSGRTTRVAGDKEHDFKFNLSDDAAEVNVKVFDSEGNLVRKMDIKSLKKGDNVFKWNGMSDDGAEARPGDYRIGIEAKASNGKKLAVKTEFTGKITGLNFTNAGPILLIGNQSIRLQDVKRIEEAGTEGPIISGPVPGLEPLKPLVKEESKADSGGPRIPKSQASVAKDVAMASGALKKYKEEMKGEARDD